MSGVLPLERGILRHRSYFTELIRHHLSPAFTHSMFITFRRVRQAFDKHKII